MKYRFWINWLRIASLLVVIFGIFMAISALFPNNIFEVFNQNIDPSFFNNSEYISQSTKNFQSWQYGVSASMLVSWGILIYFLANNPLVKREKWAWKAILVCLFGWFIIDETISIYFGVYFNALFNIGFLAMFLIPILLIRKMIKPN